MMLHPNCQQVPDSDPTNSFYEARFHELRYKIKNEHWGKVHELLLLINLIFYVSWDIKVN